MSTLEVVAALGVVVLLVLAALLAAAETSITRMSSARADSLEEEGNKRAALLSRMIDERERYINPVLFTLLGCQLGAAAIVVTLANNHWGTSGVLIAFASMLAVVFLAAEAMPKAIALADADRVALRTAPLVRALGAVAPLRWLPTALLSFAPVRASTDAPGGKVTEEELLSLTSEAAAADSIDDRELKLIESIISFGDTIAREVMVPRPDMITIERTDTIATAIELVIERGYSRLPVTGDDIDDIVGLVHAKDLMRAQRDGNQDDGIETVQRACKIYPETKRIAELMREMQAQKFHLAIVIDEYGGTAGLVSLEDLIEEVVGEIVDEFDVENPLIENRADGSIWVNGRVTIADLSDELDVELPDDEWDTVGGLIFTRLGHVPEEGESVDTANFRFLVKEVVGRRIARVQITKMIGSNDSDDQK